ncbi:hypothetical protein PC129_g3181 [Phytophthora cactorum]|uniref:Uncharacterized protein n=1 Tax=Phytophthora cactorum TaxID=29920 RepID=A0A8T1L574_9STRA|nr:hypothetical protein Pcac1_g5558 [Phytophthora cactorum]KAG2937250.1 hypothetical protein PC115_g4303 [Phytophthora cactorum]KAG2952382.1 hypothetical protein PC117_g2866 [Phytophthora cactorum]KAG3035156.1 hypothetical protein PC119_g4698 [Phytophthora cactorum]KAG3189078.1 hypothetical protein C6341_g2421 [Phytophthora cactorum]
MAKSKRTGHEFQLRLTTPVPVQYETAPEQCETAVNYKGNLPKIDKLHDLFHWLWSKREKFQSKRDKPRGQRA